MKRIPLIQTPPKNILTASFLGGAKLIWRGRVLTDFATQKVLGLFCYLLDNSEQQVSREKLTSMFWGDSPESQARYNLRYALWNIRKLFKETEDDLDPFIASRTACQIHPEFHYTTDCETFLTELNTPPGPDRVDALEHAVDRYKGQFLDGFTLRNLPDWEEWLYHRREELLKRYLEGMVEIGNHYLNSRHSSKALDIFMHALSVANDLEPAHEGIIRAYAEQGKTSAALRQYNVYVDLMRREFNAPPRPEMVKLADALRKGGEVPITTIIEEKPAPVKIVHTAPEPVHIPKPVIENVPTIISNTDPVPFIGRKQEMISLNQLLDQVSVGNGQVMIVSGEMGIGKTRLLSTFLKVVPKTFFIGIGESQEIASTQPLESLDHLCEYLLRDPRIPPDMRAEYNSTASSTVVHPEGEVGSEAAIIEAKRRWLIKLAQIGPLIILMDDLHWASDSVLMFFSNLAQEVKRLPLLLIGIFRTYENVTEDAIAPSLISIARTGRLWRIELKKLSDSETLQLITSKASDVVNQMQKEEVEKLTRFTDGIPLYAVELGSFLQEGREDIVHSPMLDDRPDFEATTGEKLIPPLMEKIASLRLSKLTPIQNEILKSASLIVGDFSVKVLKQLKELDDETLEEILVDLEYRNFIHHIERGDELIFAFNHQMVKLAIAETIPSLERRRLFKAIVNAYNSSEESCSPEAMAYYLFNSGDRVAALPFLMQSARQWFAVGEKRRGLQNSRFAFKIAMENIGFNPDGMVDIVLEHANHQVRFGMVKPALDVLNELITQLEPNTTKPEGKKLLARRDELRELLKSPTKPVSKLVSPLTLVTTKRSLANVKLLHDDIPGATALIEQIEKMLDNMEDSKGMLLESGRLLQLKAKLLLKLKKKSEATRLLENSLELLRGPGALVDLAESYLLLAHLAVEKRDWERAKTLLETATDLSLDTDDEILQSNCYHALGKICLRRDEMEDAEAYLQRAVEAGEHSLPSASEVAQLRMDYAEALFQQGKPEDAAHELDVAEECFKTDTNDDGLRKIRKVRSDYNIS